MKESYSEVPITTTKTTEGSELHIARPVGRLLKGDVENGRGKMARPLRIQYPGAFYHVTTRGNEQKGIFRSARDRQKFLEYLESATTRYGARIHVYCLMSNHYHLLVETPEGNLSRIMSQVNGAYTTYFNTKRRRFGHLVQGRYKAILVEKEEYAEELSRYIHLNPVPSTTPN